jgi:gamma-glutamylcyclotransferase (GGCT)/AIG2-like uncharacterized protein YtfP
MSIRLFAYGTLREGRAPSEIAETASQLRLIGKAVARGRLFELGAYPGAVFASPDDPGDDRNASEIDGEVFEVPDERVLRALDAYEGFEQDDPAASLFSRLRIEVRMGGSGDSVACWAYQYNRPVREVAPQWR